MTREKYPIADWPYVEEALTCMRELETENAKLEAELSRLRAFVAAFDAWVVALDALTEVQRVRLDDARGGGFAL